MKNKIVKNLVKFIFIIGFSTAIFAQNSKVQFKDITNNSGIDFKYTIGDNSYVNILESSGSGVTVFDYNNDGFMDLYLLNGKYIEGISDKEGEMYKSYHNEFYKNNGNGTFTKVTKKTGLEGKSWGEAAVPIDLDKDGFKDLYVLNYGSNVFYHNNGDGTFTDITSKLGLQGPEKLNGFTKWSIGASFFDYNLDGRLDVLVGNFLAFDSKYISTQTPGMMPHPSEYKGQASMLYEQQKNGNFIEVTKKVGLYYPNSKCMGLTVYDYDNDGDLDIFQANDHQMNFLFKNENGKFKDVGVASGVAVNSQGKPTGSMQGTVGDYDNDGLLDIFVADLRYGAIYHNLGNGLYEDTTSSSGLEKELSGKGSWGVSFFDYDNDGDLDIVAANGTAEDLILQYPLLLENDGKGHFTNIGKESGSYFSTKRSGRGLAVWDFDNDGDMDIIISHLDKTATPSLLRNDAKNGNHWLGLTLKSKANPSALAGAKVLVTIGGKQKIFVNQFATGYLSNSDPRIHIGLGKHKRIDKLEIFWTNGVKEVFNNIVANQYITILQEKGIIKN